MTHEELKTHLAIQWWWLNFGQVWNMIGHMEPDFTIRRKFQLLDPD